MTTYICVSEILFYSCTCTYKLFFLDTFKYAFYFYWGMGKLGHKKTVFRNPSGLFVKDLSGYWWLNWGSLHEGIPLIPHTISVAPMKSFWGKLICLYLIEFHYIDMLVFFFFSYFLSLALSINFAWPPF